MILRGTVLKFSAYGRYLDLILGVAMLALAWYWHSWITAALGAFSVVMFAINLNGIIQRKAMNMAVGVAQKRHAAKASAQVK